MTLDRLINVLVTITLVEMMVAVGLGVRFAELVGVVRDWGLLVRAGLANYVCVPAATVGLLLLFKAQPMVAVGFLILAVCPGAPYGPPFTLIARGNATVAVGLMVVLAGSSALLAPIFLHGLLPLLAGDETVQIDSIRIALTLLSTQLLPLCVGMAVRQWHPNLADRLQSPCNSISKVLNLAAVGLILSTQYDLLTAIRPRGFVGMVALLIVSWAAGWLLGGSEVTMRKTLTLTTSLRNVGVGLVIATGSFPRSPALTAVLVYGLFEVLGSLLLALVWARKEAAPAESVAAVTGGDSGAVP